jgi:hypothetical protein
MSGEAATIIMITATIIEIIGIDAKTKTMEIITEGLIMKNSDTLKTEMKSMLTITTAVIDTTSAMKKHWIMSQTALLWKVMKEFQVQRSSLQSQNIKGISNTRLTLA